MHTEIYRGIGYGVGYFMAYKIGSAFISIHISETAYLQLQKDKVPLIDYGRTTYTTIFPEPKKKQ